MMDGLTILQIYHRSQIYALRLGAGPSSLSSNLSIPSSLLTAAAFLLSMPAVKKQRMISQETEPISHTIIGVSTYTTPYNIKQAMWIFTEEYCKRFADRICENYSSVIRLFCYDWLSFANCGPRLASSSPRSLRQRTRGSRKQKTAAIMLQPSKSMTMRLRTMMRMVSTSEG